MVTTLCVTASEGWVAFNHNSLADFWMTYSVDLYFWTWKLLTLSLFTSPVAKQEVKERNFTSGWFWDQQKTSNQCGQQKPFMPSWNKNQGLFFFFFLFKRISQKIMLSKLLNPYFSPLINILPSLKGSLPRYFPSCQTSNAQYFKFSRRENTSVTKRKFRKGCMCKRVSPGYSQSHATGCPALLLNWWEALVRRCSRESKAVGITS